MKFTYSNGIKLASNPTQVPKGSIYLESMHKKQLAQYASITITQEGSSMRHALEGLGTEKK